MYGLVRAKGLPRRGRFDADYSKMFGMQLFQFGGGDPFGMRKFIDTGEICEGKIVEAKGSCLSKEIFTRKGHSKSDLSGNPESALERNFEYLRAGKGKLDSPFDDPNFSERFWPEGKFHAIENKMVLNSQSARNIPLTNTLGQPPSPKASNKS